LKRLIQREIADKAAVIILQGRVSEDGVISVDVVDGEFVVTGC
jgi:ATP-dependent Clp protease ATP-binding subunit ClpA